MNGLEYEKYCCEWVKKQGYHHVALTKASGDQGIDIIAYRNRKKYGFQCKYYQTPVGNDAVQQAYGGCAYYHCDYGGVITNNTFTKSAAALGEETGIMLYEKIEPSSLHLLPALYRFLTILSILLSIFMLYKSTFTDLQVFNGVICILSGICGLFYSHDAACFISVLLSLGGSILCCVQAFYSITLFFFIYFMFQLIHLVAIRKKRTLMRQKTIQKELTEEIDNCTTEIGKRLQIQLSDIFHCEITLKEASHISQEILEFTFHADRNIIEDIPLAQYEMNQFAKHEGLADQYVLESIDARSMRLRLKKCTSR